MHSHELAFILYFDDGYEHAWLNDMLGYLLHACLILTCLCFCPCGILFVCCLG